MFEKLKYMRPEIDVESDHAGLGFGWLASAVLTSPGTEPCTAAAWACAACAALFAAAAWAWALLIAALFCAAAASCASRRAVSA
jgi:hypothetical protein